MRFWVGPRSRWTRLMAWFHLPRVETFRRCSRCLCVMKDDLAMSGSRSGTTICCGIMPPWVDGGLPWCLHLETRLG